MVSHIPVNYDKAVLTLKGPRCWTCNWTCPNSQLSSNSLCSYLGKLTVRKSKYYSLLFFYH